jgi:hypothetical protein
MSENEAKLPRIASEVQARLCHGNKYIGFDFLDNDGKSYAHGHMDIDTAKQFAIFLNGLIRDLENKDRGRVIGLTINRMFQRAK